jgi:signal peptidase II
LWLLTVAIIVTDQLSKAAVTATLLPGQMLALLPPLLYLTPVHNTGAAFGLFKSLTVVLTGLSLSVAVWIIRELRTHTRQGAAVQPSGRLWALVLVLGGAIGNLIDRIRVGYVIDFIDLRWWPVFNIADSAITIGVIWLLLPLVRARKQ